GSMGAGHAATARSAASGIGIGGGEAEGAGFDGAATAPSAITATTAPTAATAPAGTRISASTPAVVEGTSIDTLSVSISNRLSPGLTLSPADLNHCVILPSATVSPSCGISTSIELFPVAALYSPPADARATPLVVTPSPTCTASPKTPSALRARLRGRCRTASSRRRGRRDRR